MKRNDNYMMTEIAGKTVLIPLGKAIVDFNGIVTLNEMGVDIWNMLQTEHTKEQIVDEILISYTGAKREVVMVDVEEFLLTLKNAGCILED